MNSFQSPELISVGRGEQIGPTHVNRSADEKYFQGREINLFLERTFEEQRNVLGREEPFP